MYPLALAKLTIEIIQYRDFAAFQIMPPYAIAHVIKTGPVHNIKRKNIPVTDSVSFKF